MKIPAGFKPSPGLAYMCVTGTAFLFATSTVVSRGVHELIPPVGGTFWRWFLASMIMLAFVWRDLPGKGALIRRHWRLIVLLGILQIVPSAILFLGLNFTTLINAAQPALTVLPAWLLTRDRITAGQALGIFAAFAGIIVMVSKGSLAAILALNFNVGDILALIAILGWTLYATLQHRMPSEFGSGVKLFVIFFSGSLAVLPFYLIETAFYRAVPATMSSVGIIAFLGIVGSLAGIALWNAALSTVGPNRATIFLNLVPVFGVSLAIIFLGEQLFSHHLAGAGLVGLGVILVVMRARKRA